MTDNITNGKIRLEFDWHLFWSFVKKDGISVPIRGRMNCQKYTIRTQHLYETYAIFQRSGMFGRVLFIFEGYLSVLLCSLQHFPWPSNTAGDGWAGSAAGQGCKILLRGHSRISGWFKEKLLLPGDEHTSSGQHSDILHNTDYSISSSSGNRGCFSPPSCFYVFQAL